MDKRICHKVPLKIKNKNREVVARIVKSYFGINSTIDVTDQDIVDYYVCLQTIKDIESTDEG